MWISSKSSSGLELDWSKKNNPHAPIKINNKAVSFFLGCKVPNLNNNIKFDTIFALSVIDHLTDPVLLIKKLKFMVLNPKI